MEYNPEQIKELIALFGKPTLGVVAFIVLILYRDFIIHLLKKGVDIIASWTTKK